MDLHTQIFITQGVLLVLSLVGSASILACKKDLYDTWATILCIWIIVDCFWLPTWVMLQVWW